MAVLLSVDQKKELVQCILEKKEENIYTSDIPCDINFHFSDLFVWKREKPLTEIRIRDLYFCLEHRLVRVRGKIIKLTVKEFDLLTLLIMHPKRVFTYEMLMDLIWYEDYAFYSRKAVNNHVSNLRKKLKIAPDIPDYIKSVYGVGYKFEV